jgi:hypothetical protein
VFNEAVKSADEKEKELNAMLASISNFGKDVTINYGKIERMNKQLAEKNKDKELLLIEQNVNKTW